MKSFMALNVKEGTQFELNYHDKNASLHVSLRTRRFDKKIHYCCGDSFFVEKACAWLKHAHSFDRCGGQTQIESLRLTDFGRRFSLKLTFQLKADVSP